MRGAVTSEAARKRQRRTPELSRGAARYTLRLAGRGDDGSIRRLLRERAMPGAIRLSFQREPSYFDGLDRECLRHDTVVVEDPHGGELIAIGARQVQPALFGGDSVRLGYLSQLRVASGRRIPLRAAREAWAILRSCRREDELPFDLTSIASENREARRLLERGVPGQPHYHFLAPYRVHVLATNVPNRSARTREFELRNADQATGGEAMALHGQACREAKLAVPGQPHEESSLRLVASRNGRIVAGLAVEDAAARRQFVVRGYEGALHWSRPIVNLVMWMRGAPLLPDVGRPLRTGSISRLTCRPGSEAAIAPLVGHAATLARRQGIDLLLAGCVPGDPVGAAIERTFRTRTYSSAIYAVAWEPLPPALVRLQPHDLHVELSVL